MPVMYCDCFNQSSRFEYPQDFPVTASMWDVCPHCENYIHSLSSLFGIHYSSLLSSEAIQLCNKNGKKEKRKFLSRLRHKLSRPCCCKTLGGIQLFSFSSSICPSVSPSILVDQRYAATLQIGLILSHASSMAVELSVLSVGPEWNSPECTCLNCIHLPEKEHSVWHFKMLNAKHANWSIHMYMLLLLTEYDFLIMITYFH